MRSRYRLGALLVLLVSALDGAGYSFGRPRPKQREAKTSLDSVDPGIPVRIQGALLPHAGYVETRTVLARERAIGRQEAVLLAPNANPYPFARGELRPLVEKLSRDPHYAVFRTPGGLLLFVPRE